MPLAPTRTLMIPCRYALSFDGIDDRVVVLDNATLRITGDLTIVVWFYRIGGTRHALVSKHYLYEYDLVAEVTEAVSFYHGNGSSYETIYGLVPNGAPYRQWVNFTLVRTLNPKKIYGYKNGTLSGSASYTYTVASGTTNVGIGARTVTLYYYTYGYISQVLIYNRALSSSEIWLNYLNMFNPVRDGLVLCLIADPQYVKDIDNDGRLEWIDLSGYNNHGKIYGAKLVDLYKAPVRALSAVRTMPVAR